MSGSTHIPWQTSSAYGIYGPAVAQLAWERGGHMEDDAKSQYSTASEGTSWKQRSSSPARSASHSQSKEGGDVTTRPLNEVVADSGEKEEGELEEGEIADDDLETGEVDAGVSVEVVENGSNGEKKNELRFEDESRALEAWRGSNARRSRSPRLRRRSRSPEKGRLRLGPRGRRRSRSPRYRDKPGGYERRSPYRYRSRERDRWRRERSPERRDGRSRSRERSDSRGLAKLHLSKGARSRRERSVSRGADRRRERADSKGTVDARVLGRPVDRLKEDTESAGGQGCLEENSAAKEERREKEQAEVLQEAEALKGKVTVQQALLSLPSVCQDLEAALERLKKAADVEDGELGDDGSIQKLADDLFFGIRTAYIVGSTGAGRSQERGKDGKVLSLIRQAHTNSRFFTSKQSKELEGWLSHLTTKASDSKPSPAVSATDAKQAAATLLPQSNATSFPLATASKSAPPSSEPAQTMIGAQLSVVQDAELAQPHLDALKRNALAYAQAKLQQAGPMQAGPLYPTPRVSGGGNVNLFVPPSLPYFLQNPPIPPALPPPEATLPVDPPRPPGFGDLVAPPGFQLPAPPKVQFHSVTPGTQLTAIPGIRYYTSAEAPPLVNSIQFHAVSTTQPIADPNTQYPRNSQIQPSIHSSVTPDTHLSAIPGIRYYTSSGAPPPVNSMQVRTIPTTQPIADPNTQYPRNVQTQSSENPKLQFSFKTHSHAQRQGPGNGQSLELIEEAFSDDELQRPAIPPLAESQSGPLDAPPGFKFSIPDAVAPIALPPAPPLVSKAVPMPQALIVPALLELPERGLVVTPSAGPASTSSDSRYNPFDTDDDLLEAILEPPGFAPPGLLPVSEPAGLGVGEQASGEVKFERQKEGLPGEKKTAGKLPGFGRAGSVEGTKVEGSAEGIALEDQKAGEKGDLAGKRRRLQWEDAEESTRDAKRGSVERVGDEKQAGGSRIPEATKSETQRRLDTELVRRLKAVKQAQGDGAEGPNRTGREPAGGGVQSKVETATVDKEGGSDGSEGSPRRRGRDRDDERRPRSAVGGDRDTRTGPREQGRRTESPRKDYRRGSGRDVAWEKQRERGRRGSFERRSPRDRGRSRSRGETRRERYSPGRRREGRRDSRSRERDARRRQSSRRSGSRDALRRSEDSRRKSAEKERPSRGRGSPRKLGGEERRGVRSESAEEKRKEDDGATRNPGDARLGDGAKSRGDATGSKSPLEERQGLESGKDDQGRSASRREDTVHRDSARDVEQKGGNGRNDGGRSAKPQTGKDSALQKPQTDDLESAKRDKPAVTDQKPTEGVIDVAASRKKYLDKAAALIESDTGVQKADKRNQFATQTKAPARNGTGRVTENQNDSQSHPAASTPSTKILKSGVVVSIGPLDPSTKPQVETAHRNLSITVANVREVVSKPEGSVVSRAPSPAESRSASPAVSRAASPLLNDPQPGTGQKPAQQGVRLETSLLGRPPKAPPGKELLESAGRRGGPTNGAEGVPELTPRMSGHSLSTAEGVESEGAETGGKGLAAKGGAGHKSAEPAGSSGKAQSGNQVEATSGGILVGSIVETAALSSGPKVGKVLNGILKKPASGKGQGLVTSAALLKCGVLRRQGSGSVNSGARSTSALTGPFDSLEAKIRSDPQVEALLSGMDDGKRAAVEAERVRRLGEQATLVADKKLCLVLDLDHTLLNSATFADIEKAGPNWSAKLEAKLASEAAACRASPGRPRELHRFPELLMWTKLRPGVATFLKKASQLFELHVYTMGNSIYATRMAQLLDPTGAYFAGRIISRGDALDAPVVTPGEIPALRSKDLDGVLGMESCVLIIDDSAKVWPHHFHNLIVVERYMYFPGSRQQFGQKGEGLFELEIDEHVHNGMLASATRVIEQVHGDFFRAQQAGGDSAVVDAREILQKIQRSVLQGVRIVFSRVFPQGTAHPEQNVKWRMAEQFGATCTLTLDDAVTHVVAAALGTDKVHWALKNNRHVVSPFWLEASAILYKRANEAHFPAPAEATANANRA